MKNAKNAVLKIVLLLPLILLINSCTKEDPKPVDPCANITCLNGGYCVNGACSCPEGYSGPDCGTQVTPVKIKISRIDVTRFPATDDGAGWDLTSGPDIYPVLAKGSSILYKPSTFYQNANPSSIYTFDLSPQVDLTEAKDDYVISLYDYDDFDADDFMGGISFVAYASKNGFPKVISLDAGGDVAFKLYVSYVW